MTDILSLKVEELVSKIKDSQLTSVEICKKYIERVNEFEKAGLTMVKSDIVKPFRVAESPVQFEYEGKLNQKQCFVLLR